MFSEVYRGRRVLVTGGTGFKGSWLCHWLQRLGAHVTCVGLAPATEPDAFTALRLGERIDSVELDVRDAHALQACVRDAGPEIVFHLAAQPIVRIAYRDPKETFDTNVGGVVNLLEAVRRQGEIEACVVITSDKVYENCEWPWGYRESDPLGGYDPYSASKAAVEIVVSSYRRSYFRGNDAKRIATARAGNVIGGGDWSADRIVPDFVRALVADRPLVLRSPAAVRPWQHVLEPLSGYLWLGACLLGPQGEQYTDAWNFGPADDACQPVGTLAELLVRAWGSGTVEIGGGTSGSKEATLLKLDCSKARATLGWHGVWTLAEAVRHTVRWYQSYYQRRDMAVIVDTQIAEYARTAEVRGVAWTQLPPALPAVA